MTTQNAYVCQKINLRSVYFTKFNAWTTVCSGAPNCMALNRHPCSAVPNTCGPCFQRHLGEEGYSNGSCFGTMIFCAATIKDIDTLHAFYECSHTDPCIDGIMNYDETDIDCGGPLCPSCELGEVSLITNSMIGVLPQYHTHRYVLVMMTAEQQCV